MQRTSRHSLLFFAIVVLFVPLCAQDTNQEFQQRLGQSFEQSEEWERAVAVYEKLYQAEPANEIFFEELQRCYLKLREYDKAINLVDERLKTQPINIGLLASLGGIYFESGSEEKADSVWNKVIAIDPKNAGLYRVVASQMMEHRLFPQAISTYLKGRTATGNDNAFTDDLASLYTVLQEYTAASTEFVRLLKMSPQQLPFIENRIASFTMHDAGLRAATDVTRDEVEKEPDNIFVRKLYAWLAMEGKDYRTALDEYRVIDRVSKADGAELFEFGQRASEEGSHLIASQAFDDVINLSHKPVIISQARFGYAHSMEDLSEEADSATTPNRAQMQIQDSSAQTRVSETELGFRNVVQLYGAVIKDYPNSDLASQSFYRIGCIRMERFSDLNGALESFARANATAKSIELKAEASLKIAEVYVLQNNLPSARNEYRGLLQIPVPAYEQSARFRIAELDYFEGKFDTSLTALKPLASNLTSNLSNDALLLQYFIMENKGTNPAALTGYAKADLLMRQQKYAEALARFTEVVNTYPTALLVDDATMKIAELHLSLNQVDQGLSTFQHVVDGMPESILRDRAQMRIAETYQRTLKDKQKAITAYEKILVKFPNSLYVEQARKRIRQLRGDAS